MRWGLYCLEQCGNYGEKLLAAIDMGLSANEREIAEKMLSDNIRAALCQCEKLEFLTGDDEVYKTLEFVL